MAEVKTKPTTASVEDFIAAVENPRRRDDARTLVGMMREISGEPPVMWGPTMIGFGRHRYVYDSGHSGETFRIGFSPRKANLVLYVGTSFEGAAELLGRLGKFRKSVACIYVNKLSDIDPSVLRALTEGAWRGS